MKKFLKDFLKLYERSVKRYGKKSQTGGRLNIIVLVLVYLLQSLGEPFLLCLFSCKANLLFFVFISAKVIRISVRKAIICIFWTALLKITTITVSGIRNL